MALQQQGAAVTPRSPPAPSQRTLRTLIPALSGMPIQEAQDLSPVP